MGNDPFAVQGGYDLVVSVKPDNENFVVIGGTNVYKIEDIVNDATFARIGGYATNRNYNDYNVGGPALHLHGGFATTTGESQSLAPISHVSFTRRWMDGWMDG